MYEYDVLAYLITVGAIASFAAIVVGLFLASYGIRKQKEREEAQAPKEAVNDVVVDAVSMEIDRQNGKFSVSLMVNTVWIPVIDVDAQKLHKEWLRDGTQFHRVTVPINVVKTMKAPRVFGGYV